MSFSTRILKKSLFKIRGRVSEDCREEEGEWQEVTGASSQDATGEVDSQGTRA